MTPQLNSCARKSEHCRGLTRPIAKVFALVLGVLPCGAPITVWTNETTQRMRAGRHQQFERWVCLGEAILEA